MIKRVVIVAAAVLFAAASPASAQQAQSIKRTPLQTFEVPGTNYQTVIGLAEVGPNVSIGRHTHPGPESGYVLEGELVVLIDGQPEIKLKPGDSYKIPPRAVHDAKAGASGAKVIATYVVEKGQPLASPASP